MILAEATFLEIPAIFRKSAALFLCSRSSILNGFSRYLNEFTLNHLSMVRNIYGQFSTSALATQISRILICVSNAEGIEEMKA
jgi:hypothetical protein